MKRLLFASVFAALPFAAYAADIEPTEYSWIEENARGAALPAVDGLNAKVAAFGGVADGNGFYGGAGSVSVLLGLRFGLQIDGIVAGADLDVGGDATLAGTAAHLFWRDPSIGLLGLYGQYVHADVLGGVDVFASAVEGALYLGRFTLEGVVGAEGGDGGSFDIDTRFFDMAQIAYYPTDNLKLAVGHS
jgi:hypothetical protein